MYQVKSIFFLLIFTFFVSTSNANVFEDYGEDLKNYGFENLQELKEFPIYLQVDLMVISQGAAAISEQVHPPQNIGKINVDSIAIHDYLFLVWFLAEVEYQGKKVLVAHLDTHILIIESRHDRHIQNQTRLTFGAVDPEYLGFFLVIELPTVLKI